MPWIMSLGSLPSFFRLIAFLALCSVPVGIVRSVVGSRRDDTGSNEELAELRGEIAALRDDLDGKFADVALAIDDLTPRRSLADRRRGDGGDGT